MTERYQDLAERCLLALQEVMFEGTLEGSRDALLAVEVIVTTIALNLRDAAEQVTGNQKITVADFMAHLTEKVLEHEESFRRTDEAEGKMRLRSAIREGAFRRYPH